MNLIGYTPTGRKEASSVNIKRYNGSTSGDFDSNSVGQVSVAIPAHYDGSLYGSKTGTQVVKPAEIQKQLQGTSSFDKWGFLYAPGYETAQYKGSQGKGPYQTALIAQNLQKDMNSHSRPTIADKCIYHIFIFFKIFKKVIDLMLKVYIDKCKVRLGNLIVGLFLNLLLQRDLILLIIVKIYRLLYLILLMKQFFN